MALFRKQLFYLTNDQLTVYQWGREGLSTVGHTLQNNESGWEAFSLHLADSKDIPIYILADLIEEDFQRVILPHVLGMARRQLIQRRLGQLYRDTPYRQAISQGRETTGRKDDRMLFSALTNAELLKPWMDAIQQLKAPLAGIYSPTLLSPFIVKKLGLESDHLLLVSRQSGGLRQSYFQGAHLKFSRLTPLTDHDPANIASIVAIEIAKTQQFLASTRLLPRGEIMSTVLLADDEELQQLQFVCQDTQTIEHRFLKLEDVAKQLNLKNAASDPLCDRFFLSVLGHNPPASQYAQPEQTRCHLLWQTRIAFYVLSGAVLAGGLAWSGGNVVNALEHNQKSLQFMQETQAAQAQLKSVNQSLPPTVASPQNMKAAVGIEQMIVRNRPTPEELLGIVSRSLDSLPQIRVNQMQWQASETTPQSSTGGSPDGGSGNNAGSAMPEQPADQSTTQNGTGATPASILIGIPEKPYQNLLIEGEVVPFQHDFRTALESVRQLAADLGKNPQLKVEITLQPLDIRPTVSLAGKAGSEDTETKALFRLKIIWKPGA